MEDLLELQDDPDFAEQAMEVLQEIGLTEDEAERELEDYLN